MARGRAMFIAAVSPHFEPGFGDAIEGNGCNLHHVHMFLIQRRLLCQLCSPNDSRSWSTKVRRSRVRNRLFSEPTSVPPLRHARTTTLETSLAGLERRIICLLRALWSLGRLITTMVSRLGAACRIPGSNITVSSAFHHRNPGRKLAVA